MEFNAFFYPLFGGLLIGTAVSLMLLLNGRITGISGILSMSLSKQNKDNLWSLIFIFGMILGGLATKSVNPDLFVNLSGRSTEVVAVAGLLVGFGTVMGSGCTSGHGICGLSRFSPRSAVATFTFMLFGFLTVQMVRHLLGDFT